MEQREAILRLWFEMWLKKADLGISDIFAPDAVYIESWGPEYHGVGKIRHWFCEWNARGTVLRWDIGQFFHRDDRTAAAWRFQDRMDDGGTPRAASPVSRNSAATRTGTIPTGTARNRSSGKAPPPGFEPHSPRIAEAKRK